jgi:hypothetical protein
MASSHCHTPHRGLERSASATSCFWEGEVVSEARKARLRQKAEPGMEMEMVLGVRLGVG